MEHQLHRAILGILRRLGKPARRPQTRYSDAAIAAVFYWSVIHDRPLSWACRGVNWPVACWRRPLPSGSTLSRRLRTESVRRLLTEVERSLTAPARPGLSWTIDGKPLVVGGGSKDRQAGYGRAVGGKAKGYKLHAIMGMAGDVAEWRLAPMNVDERNMAARMLRRAKIHGYVTADANYDSNRLHAICDRKGNLQMVAPRRHGPGRGTGHKRQTPGRLRSIEILERSLSGLGAKLLADRIAVEQRFGQLSSWGGGLTGLPPWVRTWRRVHRWVQAKLALTALRRQLA